VLPGPQGTLGMRLSFKELQAQLQPEWGLEHSVHGEGYDLCVVPSLTMDRAEMSLVPGAHHYEERQLFSLIRLRHPGVRAVYVTSKLLPDLVVDAVLELLPGVPTSHARRRLQLFDCDDASDRPLTEKLLERPALLERIAEQMRTGRSVLICYVVTELEKELSERLQIPLLGTDPALGWWGSKAGAKQLFARCGLPHPAGSPLVKNLPDLAQATATLWQEQQPLARVVVKLNEGFSGEGNACLDLTPLALATCQPQEQRQRLIQALETLPMPAPDWQTLLNNQGALVEAWLEGGDELRSPSVQGTILPGGEVRLLSTHEQILGGVQGQTYEGCRFPAAGAYRQQLMEMGRKVGEALAAEGALERFAVDALAQRQGDRWEIKAIEINLRQGGTTHPTMALNAISGGQLDPISGRYVSPTGGNLYYHATDTLIDPSLRGLLPVDLIDIVAAAGLHYDPVRQRGSVFHLLGCLSEFGKLGMTCIGQSREEAEEVYTATVAQLLAGAKGHLNANRGVCA
jgi:PGM1 C-terminal domain